MVLILPRNIFLVSFYGLILSIRWKFFAIAEDVPCLPKPGEPGNGKICVCNSTYCDTLEPPSPLPRGQYYWYSTSNSTPGFTRRTGSFSNITASINNDDIIFKINTSVQFQEILGFGGSFTDSTGLIVNSLPKDAQIKLLESYFGRSGVEYTLCRVPIGGTDFSTHFYTYDDDFPDDDGLTRFNLTNEDFTLKIPLMQTAMRLSGRGIRFMSCSWNSPSWMKTNNNHTAAYIQSKYQSSWAKYHIKFLEAYKAEGITFWSVSVGNELLLPLMFMKGMVHMSGVASSATSQRHWITRYFLPALKNSSFADVKFFTMEDERAFASYWMKRMSAYPEIFKSIAGITLHWYFDFFSSPSILDDLHKSYPDKIILYTESSINTFVFGGAKKAVALGAWDRAELYIYNIMENLDHWAQGYIDWNLVLDPSGGPYLIIPVDAAVIVNQTSGEFYKQPTFYGIGHFSKFILPGARRVEVKSNHEPPPFPNLSFLELLKLYESLNWKLIPDMVRCVATVNPDSSRTLVVLNTKNVTARILLEDADQGQIPVDIEAKSVNSFIYWL